MSRDADAAVPAEISDPAVRWETPVILGMLGPTCGAALGAIMNAINGRVSADYVAIVMSWDWAAAPSRAILQGVLEGGVVGLVFAVFLFMVTAASTALRCPPGIAVRGLGVALATVAECWAIGGAIGVTLSLAWPQLWGFFFIGVPPRVNLPRFAWVGGSIWGAYGGAAVGLIAASVMLHRRWRRERGGGGGGVRGFGVVTPASATPPHANLTPAARAADRI